MLEEALGASHAFHLRHGYHADILRDDIFETLPPGWMDRLVAVPGCTNVFAIDPHDLAAVKLMIARPKDLALLRLLHANAMIRPELARQRLDSIDKSDRYIMLAGNAFDQVFCR